MGMKRNEANERAFDEAMKIIEASLTPGDQVKVALHVDGMIYAAIAAR
jgi:hypothetical protein